MILRYRVQKRWNIIFIFLTWNLCKERCGGGHQNSHTGDFGNILKLNISGPTVPQYDLNTRHRSPTVCGTGHLVKTHPHRPHLIWVKCAGWMNLGQRSQGFTYPKFCQTGSWFAYILQWIFSFVCLCDMATWFQGVSPPMFHWCFCESQALCHFGESLFQWAPGGLVRSSLRNKVPWRRTARQMTWKSKLRTKGSWQILKGVFLTFVRFNFEISKTAFNVVVFSFFFCFRFLLWSVPGLSFPQLTVTIRQRLGKNFSDFSDHVSLPFRFVGFFVWTAKWTKKNSTENTENTAQQFFSLFCDFSPFWVFDSPFCLDRLRNEPLLSKDHDSECRRRTRSDQKLKNRKNDVDFKKSQNTKSQTIYIYITSNRAFRMEEC